MVNDGSKVDLADLRQVYSGQRLDPEVAPSDPFDLLDSWFADAARRASKEFELNAVALATADAEGRPSVRMVLLKQLDQRGATFFTNYGSHKSDDLIVNPFAAICIYWPDVAQQIRLTGSCTAVSEQESDEYFRSRPLASQIGAWASEQSQPIGSREQLERQSEEVAQRFKEGRVPRPAGWGGFRLIPTEIEFWQGQPSRLHDRLLYKLVPVGEKLSSTAASWKKVRLQP